MTHARHQERSTMADHVAEISVLLRQSVQADLRTELNKSFGLLTPQEAETLLGRILEFAPRDRLHLDFRGLHRAIRLHLLMKLVGRLTPQQSETFRTRLT